MWAFIAHPRTTDKDPLQARIQKNFPGGGGSEPRILNFNKQTKPKGWGCGGLVVIDIVLRDFLFVPLYSFNSNSVSAVWRGGGGVWGPPPEKKMTKTGSFSRTIWHPQTYGQPF